MLHACLYTIRFVFCYTSWRFYAFSRTKLLTRCHSASSLFFCCFCVSEKLHRKYSQNWMKQKPKFLFFLTWDGVQSRDGGGPGASHTIGWCAPTPGHATRWWGRLAHLLTLLFCLYILLGEENLRPRSISMKHTASRRHRWHEIGRVQKLFPAPCRRGELPPEAFFITMPAFGVMCE
jgi:hypothetical protein